MSDSLEKKLTRWALPLAVGCAVLLYLPELSRTVTQTSQALGAASAVLIEPGVRAAQEYQTLTAVARNEMAAGFPLAAFPFPEASLVSLDLPQGAIPFLKYGPFSRAECSAFPQVQGLDSLEHIPDELARRIQLGEPVALCVRAAATGLVHLYVPQAVPGPP